MDISVKACVSKEPVYAFLWKFFDWNIYFVQSFEFYGLAFGKYHSWVSLHTHEWVLFLLEVGAKEPSPMGLKEGFCIFVLGI